MTLIRVIIAACLIWMAALPTAAAEGFLSGIEDLPLMPGLTEDADGAVNFETATGRIVEIKASGAVQSADITAFYAEVLPQLGWIAEENGAAGMYI
ncbi:MAG: hypothetical protein O2944_06875, partial [Proteobacteria bacterium]|nr:hypothetical protein [Pseudomonadota bacterium]